MSRMAAAPIAQAMNQLELAEQAAGCYTLYDMTKRASRVLAVSVPPESADDFDRIARQEGRNRSEMFREMLRIYRAYRESATFESLQRYGSARARALGVRDEGDVDRLIQEARST